MRWPEKLNKKTMKKESVLHPIEMNAKIELSSVSILNFTLPFDESISPDDWIEYETPDGSKSKFRVSKIVNSYGKNKNVSLLHGICTLGDTTINGEGIIKGTFAEIVSQLLEQQENTYWELGNFVQTEEETIEFYNDNLLELFIEVQSIFGDYAVTYDMDDFPWKINIVKLPEKSGCHGRFSRNLDGVTINVLKDNLCTRVKIDGIEGHVDSDTIDKYGIISKVIYVAKEATETQKQRYIKRFFDNYKEPIVSIKLDVRDLYTITGEFFDKFELGKICHCYLPEDNLDVDLRIVTLEYVDLIGSKEKVYVSLNKKMPTLRDILVDQQKQQRKSGAGRKRQEKKNKEFSDLIYDAYIDIDKNRGNIDLYAEKLNQLTNEKDILEIRLDSEVEKITIRATELQNDIEAADARITVNAREIEQRVKSGELISSINQTAEEIKISANKINLSGYVTVSQLQSTNASISNITSGITTATVLKATLFTGETLDVTYGKFDSITFGGKLCSRRSVEVSTPSGSTTLYYLAYTP